MSDVDEGLVNAYNRMHPDVLFEKIKHGDAKHRRWLLEALWAAWRGQDVPRPT